MKKPVIGLLLLIALVAVAWVSSAFYIGRQIESSLADYEVLFTRAGGLAVHQLEYQPGLFGGELHYDLELQPVPGSELAELAAALQEEMGISLRATGTADVRHGPFVGGRQPLALARMEMQYRLPDSFRDSLPQYPGDRPLFEVSSLLGFDGSLQNHLAGVNYDGTLVIDNESAEFTLAGLTGELSLDSQLSTMEMALDLEALRLAPEEVELLFENLRFGVHTEGTAPDLTMEMAMGHVLLDSRMTAINMEMENLQGQWQSTQLRPSIWLGGGEMSSERLAFSGAGFTGELLGLQSTSLASLDDNGRYQAVSESLVSRLNVGSYSVSDLAFDASLRNINVDAYAELMLALSGGDPGAADSDALLQRLTDSVSAILVDQPVVSLDRLAVSVIDSDDIALSSSITYVGPAMQNFLDPAELVAGLEVQGDVSLAVPAVRRLIEIGLAMADPSLQGMALANAVDANYQQLLSSLQNTDFLVITDESITTSLQVRNGIVTLNGTELMTVDDLLTMVAGPDTSGAIDYGQVVMQPDFLGDPRFERISLDSGFTPDPHTTTLLASGQRPAMEVLAANCAGNVYSAQPDFTLTYAAGPDYGLYLYAESETDTTLVVLTPQGWACDDDSHGDFNPGVSIDAPVSGDYLIWVGTYEEGSAQAVLGISEF